MYKLNKKFNKFIYGIGGIPATYLESLSYEEQLLWFSKNLDELINSVNLSMTYSNYQDLIFEFNTLEKDVLNVGQNIYIDTLNCYDLYISEIRDTQSIYYYSNDNEIKTRLATDGYIQIGYYVFRPIESYIDLSNYVTTSSLNNTLSNYELISNKVTSLSSSSTDNEYPSAKCVYDIIGDVESLLGGI